MARFTIPALENELGQRVVTAASAAAMTYIRPARFPRWVRRSITMSNSLTAVGAALAGNKTEAAHRQIAKDNVGRPASEQTLTVRDGVPASQVGANWASSAAAGMALVTSGIALAVDKRVEKFLLARGVRNPRVIMAVGAAALSMASPYVTKGIQNLTEKLQAQALPKDVLDARLANPLGQRDGQQDASAAQPSKQLGAGETSTTNADAEIASPGAPDVKEAPAASDN